MKISIVVPFHNEELYLERCLTSLGDQDYPKDRYEIILVDNNSTDRSADVVRRFPRARLLSEAKRGSYAARNTGVAASTGEIIAFTDADCSPARDWLTTIRRHFEDPRLQVVQGRVRFARESLALSVLADYETAKAAHVFSSANPRICYGYTNNMAIRRTVFASAGPFEEMERGADVILVHRVIERFSLQAIAFAPGMDVRHWEIENVRVWLRKMSTYGRSIQGYGPIARAEPLGRADRSRVLHATIRDNRYGPGRSAVLIVLLSIGMVFYEAGRVLNR